MNNRYFAAIDTEHKAYWLGVLLAKGRLMPKKNGEHSLSLRSKYYALPQMLIEDLEDLQAVNVGRKGQFSATFHDKPLLEDLARYGVVPGKSTGNYLDDGYEQVSDDLFHHFLRGLFDANGQVDTFSDKRIRIAIASSDLGLVQHVQERVRDLSGIHVSVDTHSGYGVKTGRVLGRKGVLAMRDWLYDGATRFLVEKRQELMEIPEEADRPPGINKGLVPVTGELRLILQSLKTVTSNNELARMMGVQRGTLQRVAAGRGEWVNEEFVNAVLAFCQEHRIGPFALV